jgi:signal peptidase I
MTVGRPSSSMPAPTRPSLPLRGRRHLLFAVGGISALALALPLRPGVVLGDSMAPAFHSGQVFLLSRLQWPPTAERGDVIVFEVDGLTYLKRVYAVGGDSIWGMVPKGSTAYLESVIAPASVVEMRALLQRRPGLGRLVRRTVPPGYVFVLGDAAANSYDSRHFGPVPLSAVTGRVVVPSLYSLWPSPGRKSLLSATTFGDPAHKREAGRPGGGGRPVRSTESRLGVLSLS